VIHTPAYSRLWPRLSVVVLCAVTLYLVTSPSAWALRLLLSPVVRARVGSLRSAPLGSWSRWGGASKVPRRQSGR